MTKVQFQWIESTNPIHSSTCVTSWANLTLINQLCSKTTRPYNTLFDHVNGTERLWMATSRGKEKVKREEQKTLSK